jgi:hypothetical protein
MKTGISLAEDPNLKERIQKQKEQIQKLKALREMEQE